MSLRGRVARGGRWRHEAAYLRDLPRVDSLDDASFVFPDGTIVGWPGGRGAWDGAGHWSLVDIDDAVTGGWVRVADGNAVEITKPTTPAQNAVLRRAIETARGPYPFLVDVWRARDGEVGTFDTERYPGVSVLGAANRFARGGT